MNDCGHLQKIKCLQKISINVAHLKNYFQISYFYRLNYSGKCHFLDRTLKNLECPNYQKYY